jgi:hypothetical protein
MLCLTLLTMCWYLHVCVVANKTGHALLLCLLYRARMPCRTQ